MSTVSRPKTAGAVHTTVHDAVASITISNPARRNALSTSMMADLGGALRRIDDDPEVAVVVVRGDGSTFVAGADISEFEAQQNSAEVRRAADEALAVMFDALGNLSKPLIAVIQGYCIGAGMAVALGADIRIAATGSRFAIPAARLSIGYPLPEVHMLVSIVGPARAAEILFTSDQFSADEALAAGLINRIVDPAELEAEASELARRLAGNAPLSIRAAKAAIRASVMGTPELRATAEKHISACVDSADAREGQRAFLAKRAPHFTGR